MPSLLTALDSRPLYCDGAMGSQLFAAGLAAGSCGMLWNVDRPADVSAIHRAYRTAGCDLITTNSFGGSSSILSRHNLTDRAAELNRSAALVARAVAGDTAWVLADVGPFGDFLEPLGDTTEDELREIFRAQIAALLEGGADAVLIETISDPAEAAVAVQAAKSCNSAIPVIVTYAFQKAAPGEFRTMMGSTVTDSMRSALDAGASIVGANCGTALALDDYVVLAGQIVAAASGAPVIIQPNAGAPRVDNGHTLYDATPAQLGATAAQLIDAGVRIVGGCCGTTPAHLAQIAATLHKA